ncbi:hypothetical protein PLICRDRAFT_209958 [Plicaturopsis crispa FD-325 SS-3]|nr:hypothetical protein PLICRDRAFT_209958 [Plicaturopsis crispa FD-325 SS-3]
MQSQFHRQSSPDSNNYAELSGKGNYTAGFRSAAAFTAFPNTTTTNSGNLPSTRARGASFPHNNSTSNTSATNGAYATTADAFGISSPQLSFESYPNTANGFGNSNGFAGSGNAFTPNSNGFSGPMNAFTNSSTFSPNSASNAFTNSAAAFQPNSNAFTPSVSSNAFTSPATANTNSFSNSATFSPNSATVSSNGNGGGFGKFEYGGSGPTAKQNGGVNGYANGYAHHHQQQQQSQQQPAQPYLNGHHVHQPHSHTHVIQSQTPYGPHLPLSNGVGAGGGQSATGPGLGAGGQAMSAGAGQSGGQEEISTIFVVGFPDDMQEREFQNMFTFSSGFEAATLKIPTSSSTSNTSANGSYTSAATALNNNARGGGGYTAYLGAGAGTGAGDPYNMVTVNQGGVVVDAGRDGGTAYAGREAWPTTSGTSNNSWATASAGTFAGPPSMSLAADDSFPGGANSGPRKQIIGFAKFRTRAEALEARDGLQGRRVDIEKGAVLKAEMAKKNLHTKRGPGVGGVGVGSSGPEGVGGMQQQQQGASEMSVREREQGVLGAMGFGSLPLHSWRDEAAPLPPAHQRGPRERLEDELRRKEKDGRLRSAFHNGDSGYGNSEAAFHEAFQAGGDGAFEGAFHGGNGENAFHGAGEGLWDAVGLAGSTRKPSPPSYRPYSPAESSSASAAEREREDGGVIESMRDLTVSTDAKDGAEGGTSPQLPSPASGGSSSGGTRGAVDQNPPINTLYVGNLPTSQAPAGYPPNYLEESLRELFQRRQGYRKLCYRHKPAGPMCFVEFDDVAYATKALNDLYGNTLNGLIKGGGIRLSYSKNPLGVRTPTSASSDASGFRSDATPIANGNGNGGSFGYMSSPPPRFSPTPRTAHPFGYAGAVFAPFRASMSAASGTSSIPEQEHPRFAPGLEAARAG